MPILFAATLFVSALLLFMVQPMIGRMILPLLGGSPAAWNTCMVFFQFVLLLGYLYAHKLVGRFSPKQQVLVHAGVLSVAIVTFAAAVMLSERSTPIAIVKSLAPQSTAYPMFGVMALLAVAIGVPFFAVSTSAPLLQKWFANTGHAAAKDPYFLYAASNAGSLLSLLLYPLLTEPSLKLNQQSWLFACGFGLLAVLVLLCGWIALKGRTVQAIEAVNAANGSDAPTNARIFKWVMLAFVPSSLMLGVTFYMTTDIASIPLLWVIPLALYLFTFIIAFMRLPTWFRTVIGNVAPVITLLLLFVVISQQPLGSMFWLIGLHIAAFFLLALMCHSELAFDRPPPQYLTNFFLWISVGGMLGGVFNALLAPIAFPLPYEYPIALVIGCLLVPKLSGSADSKNERRSRLLDVLIPVVMLVAVAWLNAMSDDRWLVRTCYWIAEQCNSLLQFCGLDAIIGAARIRAGILWAIPLIACFLAIERPLRFGLCVAAVVLVGEIRYSASEAHTERSFFGILKIQEDVADANPHEVVWRKLVHGTTLHGMQVVEPWLMRDDLKDPLSALVGPGLTYGFNWRDEPLTYYHRTGPVGHMFAVAREKNPKANCAMVGLGSGSVSCYADKNLAVTFYEIDPTVKAMVADTDKYFSYVTDARRRGAEVPILLGDARLMLEKNKDAKYDLLLIDAFSSDSIPVHLLTEEALSLYLERLTPEGLLSLHISNKFVELEVVVAALAKKLDIAALVFDDHFSDDDNDPKQQIAPFGKTSSSWVVLAKDPRLIEIFKEERFTTQYRFRNANLVLQDKNGNAVPVVPPINSWKPLHYSSLVKPWTDDYADVLMVMRLEQVQSIRKLFGHPTLKDIEGP